MQRLKHLAPSLVLIVLTAAVLTGGPRVARQLAWAEQSARIELARDRLQDLKTSKLAELSDAFREVARATEPSVVHIAVARRVGGGAFREVPNDLRDEAPSTPEELRQWLERRRAPGDDDDERLPGVPEPFGNGSGWVYADGSHIVTNLHVVRGADEIKVRFADKTERLARVVGFDEQTDIAVLELRDDMKMHPALLAKDPVEQGDIVFAFGSPFQFEFSMSQGIVSGKGRRLGILGATGYENFIQTDAAINPGNSGGPLTNIYGEVIGMNTAIATRNGGSQGIGFAIPTSMIRSVVGQIITNGRVRRGYIGVGIKTLTAKMAESFKYEGGGVLITRIEPGMPADVAGLEPGDIISEIDGKPVATSDDLRNLIASYPPDTKLLIKVFRDGKSIDKNLQLVDQQESPWLTPGAPAKELDAEQGNADESDALKQLGFEKVRNLDPGTAVRLGLDEPGVVAVTVRPHSVAAVEGIRPGTVIVAVGETKVANVSEFKAALAKADLKKGIRLHLKERDFEDFVLLAIP